MRRRSQQKQHELDKLYVKLTAKERAKIEILRSHRDQERDALLEQTTPYYQVAEVNAYLTLAGNTDTTISAMVLWLSERVRRIDERYQVLLALQLYEILADTVDGLLRSELPEAVTETEYARRLEEVRAMGVTIEEASYILVDAELNDEDYERDRERQQHRVEEAVARGTILVEEGELQYGGLMDWAGEKVVVAPTYGFRLRVLPDSVSGYVAEMETFSKHLERTSEEGEKPEGVWRVVGVMRRIALQGIEDELRDSWAVRLGLEEVGRWAAEDLDGLELTNPRARAEMARIREAITSQAARLEQHGRTVELPGEANAELVQHLKERISTAFPR